MKTITKKYEWNTKTERCAYCGADIEDTTTVPAGDDDAAWGALGRDHYPGCEWVSTRAHSRD